MNLSLSHPLRRRMMMAPRTAKTDASAGGGRTGDYGDDFTPTEDDTDEGGDAPSGDTSADDADPKDEGGEGEGGEDEGEGEGGLREGAAVEGADAAKADGKPATATPRASKGGAIPLDRHEKILAKERQRRELLEAQLAQSNAGKDVAKHNDALEKLENDLVDLETAFNKALSEGNTDGARGLQTQIRHKNAELVNAQVEQRTSVAVAQAVETVRYDAALDRIEAAYPKLNPDSDEFDGELMDDVVDMMDAGKRRGLTPTKALQRAVERLLGAATAKQESATKTTPRVDEEAAEAAAATAAGRKTDAVKRNLDAARRTPPGHAAGQSGDTHGNGLTAKGVMSMSDEEYRKLGTKELARLRGDFA